VKTVLSRWDSVVEHNRVADQLEFPSKGSGVQVHETNIFNSVMNPKTEIEKKVQALLQENGYTAKKLKVNFQRNL
jgi:U3 small nucleolar RNA-associated protein 14